LFNRSYWRRTEATDPRPSFSTFTVDGLTFKDLNRNGRLDPYEDWGLPADVRAADLVQRMSLEELAGVMVHGTLPSVGPMAPLGVGKLA
jgi:beta-glucosidase